MLLLAQEVATIEKEHLLNPVIFVPCVMSLPMAYTGFMGLLGFFLEGMSVKLVSDCHFRWVWYLIGLFPPLSWPEEGGYHDFELCQETCRELGRAYFKEGENNTFSSSFFSGLMTRTPQHLR